MKISYADNLTAQDTARILQLWNNEYPATLTYDAEDFDSYLTNLTDKQHYILRNDNDDIHGWAFSFLRNDERWFAVIIDTAIHGRGYGQQLLDKLKENNQELYGWVTDHNRYVKHNGEPYRSPLGFYSKCGFTIHPETRLELEKLSAVKISWRKS